MGYFPFPVVKHLVPKWLWEPRRSTLEVPFPRQECISTAHIAEPETALSHTVMWLMFAMLSNVKVINCTLRHTVNWIADCVNGLQEGERELFWGYFNASLLFGEDAPLLLKPYISHASSHFDTDQSSSWLLEVWRLITAVPAYAKVILQESRRWHQNWVMEICLSLDGTYCNRMTLPERLVLIAKSSEVILNCLTLNYKQRYCVIEQSIERTTLAVLIPSIWRKTTQKTC